MNLPLVSVIIPNYNYERSLELCVQSALDQAYDSVEITVVDDGSTDGSVAIAERMGVQVLRTPSNSGCAATRNLGVASARGEILFFLDSDVALASNAIANAVEILQSDPTIGAVCGIYDP
jgi:glycosyltransferase involved in cell wall biosynthesis